MIASLRDYVNFLAKHNMSGDQFLFCCLIYEQKFDLIYKIFNERGGFDRDELNDLEDRGYVINLNKENDTWADMYNITDKFRSEIYGDEFSMWKEFTDTYPQFIFIEGKKIPAQSTDLDFLRVAYMAKIGRSPILHKKIIEHLIYASDHDMINMGIEKWVKGEQWRAIESHRVEQPKTKARDEREF